MKTLVIAALALVASVANAEPVRFSGSVGVSIWGFPVARVPGSGTADLVIAGGLPRLSIPADAFVGTVDVLPNGDAPASLGGLRLEVRNEAGTLARATSEGTLGGSVPLHGVARFCFFAACGDSPAANVTLPISAVGRRSAQAFAQGGAMNLTVRGAPWTTATVFPQVGYAQHGAAGTGQGTLVVHGLAPILVWSDLPEYRIGGYGQIRVVAGNGCDDGVDNDGDGAIDAADAGCADAEVPSERGDTAECNDGFDNDTDHRIDWPSDPGCDGPDDELEYAAGDSDCWNHVDDDGDGRIDSPRVGGTDPGCAGAWDLSESTPRYACDDGLDNDGDGKIDRADPGCPRLDDFSEADVVECANGIDDDGDGATDYPADAGCSSASAATERAACENGIDDDRDGLVDFPADPGCFAATDPGERTAQFQCDDGLDNDNDYAVDMNDLGCLAPSDPSERYPESCSDFRDNDLDGLVDWPADPGCFGPDDPGERSPELVCDDDVDNDGDGRKDHRYYAENNPYYVGDYGCADPADPSETSDAACGNGVDDDGDGEADAADLGCANEADDDERGAAVCDNGLDDDGDGLADRAQDPGCGPFYYGIENPVCDDDLDNDGDGATDYPADAGCSTAYDIKEDVDCSDGQDDDADGLVDFPVDPGCSDAADESEIGSLVCDNARDDDGDGRADADDPGCSSAFDPSEKSALACDDGVNNDGDFWTDYQAPVCDVHSGCYSFSDPGCSGPDDPSETDPAIGCDDGLDNDGDGLVDVADPGCSWPIDDEIHPTADCDDGADDDGDGLIDAADPGCVGPLDPSERSSVAACDDGIDQDGDTAIDFPADADCSSPLDAFEGPDGAACGNGQDDDRDGLADAADPSCASPDDTEEAVLLDGGVWYVADATTSYANESVRLANGVARSRLAVETGGAVGHDVTVEDTSWLRLEGGAIGGDVAAGGRSWVEIEAGSVAGAIRARDEAYVVIRGGDPGEMLEVSDGAIVAIEVEAAESAPVTGLAGTLTATLRDGTPISLPFLRDATASIQLVPEPGTIASALGAIGALLALRRRAA